MMNSHLVFHTASVRVRPPPLEENSDFAPIRPLEPAADALPTGSILGNSMHMSLFQGQRQWRG